MSLVAWELAGKQAPHKPCNAQTLWQKTVHLCQNLGFLAHSHDGTREDSRLSLPACRATSRGFGYAQPAVV